jgi:hypothetical protein
MLRWRLAAYLSLAAHVKASLNISRELATPGYRR